MWRHFWRMSELSEAPAIRSDVRLARAPTPCRCQLRQPSQQRALHRRSTHHATWQYKHRPHNVFQEFAHSIQASLFVCIVRSSSCCRITCALQPHHLHVGSTRVAHVARGVRGSHCSHTIVNLLVERPMQLFSNIFSYIEYTCSVCMSEQC